MESQPTKKAVPSNPIERLGLLFLFLIILTSGLLYVLRTQVKTLRLLKDQQMQLERDQRILISAEEIYEQYKGDIDTIANVFPDEEGVLDFLQTMEMLVKQYGEDSSVRFASKNPLPEGDKLFLLFTLGIKTDVARLDEMLERLENLTYMTRVVSINVSWPNPGLQTIFVSLQLKLYVKNPFVTK